MKSLFLKHILSENKDRLLETLLLLKFRYNHRNKSFYCRALQGLSNYNICINADMTVSCNCQDYKGAGQIGDLKRQTFEEIYFGPKAQSFRKSLADGKIPIAVCMACSELMEVDKGGAESKLSAYSLPVNGIMVESTVACTLKCLGCKRHQLLRTRKKLRMSLADVSQVADIINDHKIRMISYFNLGEPFLSDTVLEEIRILKSRNPKLILYTSTNGMLLDSEKKTEAAMMMDHILFSIDGSSQDSVAKYQVGGDFRRSYENMKNMVQIRNEAGTRTPIIEWKYVVFAWNDSVVEIERAIAMAKEAHVDILSFWPGGGSRLWVSSKFHSDPYFLQLGNKSWKGREIRFCDLPDNYML